MKYIFAVLVIVFVVKISCLHNKTHHTQQIMVNNETNKTANYTYQAFTFPKRNDSLLLSWKNKQPTILNYTEHIHKQNSTSK